MQPAEEEGAESVAVVALRSDVKQQQNYRQNEAGDYCVSQRSTDPSHFHSPKQRYSPCFDASRERTEEHTSELQLLMRISYAVLCLLKKPPIMIIPITS